MKNAPAQQVAHRAYTISMLDGAALKALVEKERPDYIVPEVEAIATDTLIELEKAGFNVVPTAKATKLTMNRERYSPFSSRRAWPANLSLSICR